MRRASYRTAVELIALNDDPEELNPEVIAGTVSVGLIASLFEVEADRVAKDVARFRMKERIEDSPEVRPSRGPIDACPSRDSVPGAPHVYQDRTCVFCGEVQS